MIGAALPVLPLFLVVIGVPLLVGVGAGLFLLLPAAQPRLPSIQLFNGLSIGAAAVSLAGSLGLMIGPPGASSGEFLFVRYHVDALSIYFMLMINIVALAAAWSSWGFLRYDAARGGAALAQPPARLYRNPFLFHMLINFFHVTMLLVTVVDNLVVLWVAIEATTLVSTLLISYQNRKSSWEAAWRYLILTSTGIIFALLGTMLLAVAIGTPDVNYSELLTTLRGPGATAPAGAEAPLVLLSFLFILIGYGTKAGLAPMQTWLPDGHGEAPAPISALLSGVLLKCALFGILRFYTITNLALGPAYQGFTPTILLGVGLGSLILAVPFILKENRFKRVLAYHSLEHMGIIVFGLGINVPLAVYGALLHVLNHAVTKALMFLAYGQVQQHYAGLEQATAAPPGTAPAPPLVISGVLRSMPVTGSLLAIGGLALVGAPPFNIFLSEALIVAGAFIRVGQAVALPVTGPAAWGGPLLAAATGLFLLTTVLIFFGLIRHLARLLLAAAPFPRQPERFRQNLVPLLLLAGLVVGFGLTIVPPVAGLLDAAVRLVLPLGDATHG